MVTEELQTTFVRTRRAVSRLVIIISVVFLDVVGWSYVAAVAYFVVGPVAEVLPARLCPAAA